MRTISRRLGPATTVTEGIPTPAGAVFAGKVVVTLTALVALGVYLGTTIWVLGLALVNAELVDGWTSWWETTTITTAACFILFVLAAMALALSGD